MAFRIFSKRGRQHLAVNIGRDRTVPPSLLYAYWHSSQSSITQRTSSVALRFVKILLFHKRKPVNSLLMKIPCGRVSCDFAFDCIPVVHEKLCNFLPAFLPLAGDVIHPALRNRRVWGRDYFIPCMCQCRK